MRQLSQTFVNYAARKLAGRKTRPSDGKLIVVEGLDGVGKSTTVRALAENLGATPMASPIADVHRQARARIDELAFTNPLRRFRFYWGANDYDSARVLRPHLEAGRSIILDRYEITTLVAHAALGVDLDPEIQAITDPNAILPADLTLFLNLSEEERLARLAERAKSQVNTVLDDKLDYQRRMQGMYDQLEKHGLVHVDIDGLSVDEVTDKVNALVLSHIGQ